MHHDADADTNDSQTMGLAVIGKVEAIVLRSWGHGVRIDAGDKDQPAAHGVALAEILREAREIDDNEGRCGHVRFADKRRCALPRGHEGPHAPDAAKETKA